MQEPSDQVVQAAMNKSMFKFDDLTMRVLVYIFSNSHTSGKTRLTISGKLLTITRSLTI